MSIEFPKLQHFHLNGHSFIEQELKVARAASVKN
jgi:hypothetical protein